MSQHKKINTDTAHRWAHQIGDYSETKGGRLFFRGDTIYSYGSHFPIARHVTKRTTDGRCILFTTRGYSNTTTRHISEVRQSIPGYLQVFNVENVDASNTAAHVANLRDYDERIAETAANLKKLRSPSRKDWATARLAELIKQRNAYNKFFALRHKPIEGDDIEKLSQAAEKAKQHEAARAKREQKEKEKKNAVAIQSWVNGDAQATFPWSVQKVYLRSHRQLDGELVIQTSKNAEVPYEHARRAYRIIKKLRDAGKTFKANGHTIKLGHYAISLVDNQGTVHIGCHQIEWAQVKDLAAREGWDQNLTEGHNQLAEIGESTQGAPDEGLQPAGA